MTQLNVVFDEDTRTLAAAAAVLASGKNTSEQMVALALQRAKTPRATAVFTRLRADDALREARASDIARSAGFRPSTLAGIPISVKDLFDISGEVTAAGSAVLAEGPPAVEDATVIRRLRFAGAVLVGRTNMTELAFSGLGLNPHFGTPINPTDLNVDRIPGGSSSGAAVSVALGIVSAAIGTDTGGSVRIPAALCGLVGFKPTADRISLQGVSMLSPSLDSIGPIACSVACCTMLDAVLSGRLRRATGSTSRAAYRIAVPRNLVWDDMDEPTSRAVQAAMTRLAEAGSTLVEVDVPEFAEVLATNSQGGLPAAESFALHHKLLDNFPSRIDPRVRSRIERGRHMTAAHYIQIANERHRLQRQFYDRMNDFDFWLMPTVPQVAPPIAALAADDQYFAANARMLRNPSLVNFLNGCAITLPCQPQGSLPVGISLVAATHQDCQLLAAAARLEAVVTSI